MSHDACRNRSCAKCQGAAARQWLADREADLLSVLTKLCCVDGSHHREDLVARGI